MASSLSSSSNDPQLRSKLVESSSPPPPPPPPSSSNRPLSSLSDVGSNSTLVDSSSVGHGSVVPLWFNDLIQHGFNGLLSIVTKNLSITKDGTANEDFDSLSSKEYEQEDDQPPILPTSPIPRISTLSPLSDINVKATSNNSLHQDDHSRHLHQWNNNQQHHTNVYSNANNDRNNATFNDNNDGKEDDDGEEDNDVGLAGGNAIKELIATSAVSSGRNETPITTATTIGEDDGKGKSSTTSAIHPTIPATAEISSASCREDNVDEDVDGSLVAGKGAIDDASHSKDDSSMSTSIVQDNAVTSSSTELSTLPWRSFSASSAPLTTSEEVPRPGIVKLTKSKFEQKITSLDKGNKEAPQQQLSMTAPNYNNELQQSVHWSDGSASSCATRMAGGNNDNDRTEDDHRHNHKIPIMLDYGRGSTSTHTDGSIDAITDSSALGPPVTSSAASVNSSTATCAIVASSASSLPLTSFTQAYNGNERQPVETLLQVDAGGDTVQVEEVVKCLDAKDVVVSALDSSASLTELDNRGNDHYDNRAADREIGEDERQTRLQVQQRPDDYAFQADGHELKFTQSDEVVAVAGIDQPPREVTQPVSATCLCSTKGGNDHGTATLACTSSASLRSIPEHSTTLLLLSCATSSSHIEISDLTAACNHHHRDDDDEEQTLKKSHNSREGEDLEEATRRHGRTDEDRLLPLGRPSEDNELVVTAASVDDDIRTLLIDASGSGHNGGDHLLFVDTQTRSATTPLIAARHGGHNNDSVYSLRNGPQSTQRDPVNNQCQSSSVGATYDRREASENHSTTRNDQHQPGAHHHFPESSSFEFNVQPNHRSQSSLTLLSLTSPTTPPPTPTVSSPSSVFAFDEVTSSSPSTPTSPSVFGHIKRLRYLPRLRSSIVEFERQNSTDSSPPNSAGTTPVDTSVPPASTERFIVQIKSLVCDRCLSSTTSTETRFASLTSGDHHRELYLIKLNLFRRTTKTCPVTATTDPDVQFSLDQLFQQLSIVSSSVDSVSSSNSSTAKTSPSSYRCSHCERVLFPASNPQPYLTYRPLIFYRNQLLPPNVSVVVNLCSQVSHNLWFTFGPPPSEATLSDSLHPDLLSCLKMVEENGLSTASAPNRLILLRSQQQQQQQQHNVNCRYYHHQKRPSSVNSSSSGSDHTKESDPECTASDNSASDGIGSDCEYGPGFVGRLRNKFMTLYGQDQPVVVTTATAPTNLTITNGQQSAIKRCSSMEELTYRTKNGAPNGLLIPNNQPNGIAPTINGNSGNHHQQVNGTKKRLLWSSMNGNSNQQQHNHVLSSPTKEKSRSFVKNGHNTNQHSQQPVNGFKPKEVQPVLTNGTAVSEPAKQVTANSSPLYPSNIVKNLVKNHEPTTPKSLSSSPLPNGQASAQSNGTSQATVKNGQLVRHYPSPITNNYIRSNLYLTAPVPYIRKSKSVEALSAPFHTSINASGNGTVTDSKLSAYLVPVEVEIDEPKTQDGSGADLSFDEKDGVVSSNQKQSTGNLQTNDESLCCHQSTHNGAATETAAEVQQQQQQLPIDTTLSHHQTTNEHDCSSGLGDQSVMASAAAAAAATLLDHQRVVITATDNCELLLKASDDQENNHDDNLEVKILEDNRLSNDINLDLNLSSSSLPNDSGICESSSSTNVSSLASTTAATMNGDCHPAVTSHRHIDRNEMPQQDIVKTYKLFFEPNATPTNTSSPVGQLIPVPVAVVKSSPNIESLPQPVNGTLVFDGEPLNQCDDSVNQSESVKASSPAISVQPPAVPSRTKPLAGGNSNSSTKPSPTVPARNKPEMLNGNNNKVVKPPVVPRRTNLQAPSNSTKTTTTATPSTRSPDAQSTKTNSELNKVRASLNSTSSSSTTAKPMATANVASPSAANSGARFGKPSPSTVKLVQQPTNNSNRPAKTPSMDFSTSTTKPPPPSLTSSGKVIQSNNNNNSSGTTTTQSSSNVTDKVFPPSPSVSSTKSSSSITAAPQPAPSDNSGSNVALPKRDQPHQHQSSTQQASANNSTNGSNNLIADAAKKLKPIKPVANIRPWPQGVNGATAVGSGATTIVPSPPLPAATSKETVASQQDTTGQVVENIKPTVTGTKPSDESDGKSTPTDNKCAQPELASPVVSASSATTKPLLKNEVIKPSLPSTPEPARQPSPSAMSSSSSMVPKPVSSSSSTSNSTEVSSTKPSGILKNAPNQSTVSSHASSTAVPSATRSTLWAKSNPPPPNSGASSIVFDFRDKSVKANIAITPAPFGSTPIPASVAKEIKAINGDASGQFDYDDDDLDDVNYCGSMEMPQPSGIYFHGENVVHKKSCIMVRRNKNLSIQFNESICTTFEYTFDDNYDEEDTTDRPNAKLSSNSSSLQNKFLSGNSNLASYTPSQFKEGTTFELGVTKSATPAPLNSVNTYYPTAEFESLDSAEVNQIVPASQEDTVSFSKSSTASDLLF